MRLPLASASTGTSHAESKEQFKRRLQLALERAHRESGKIDAIIFPELALTQAQYDMAERLAFREGAILIAGMREKRGGAFDWDLNWSVLQPVGMLRAPSDRYRH